MNTSVMSAIALRTSKSRLLFSIAVSLILTGVLHAQTPQAKPIVSPPAVAIPSADLAHLAVARDLVKAGGLELALDYLQNHPPRVSSIEIWEAWAEQKWSILELLEEWHQLKRDAHGLPASFGATKYFAIPYEARAMIALGELDAARRLLQPALLADSIPIRIQRNIRQQLISLYRAQGDYVNAKIEAVRFHNEFKPQDTQWYVQRAVIEYLAGDAMGASQLLAPIATIEAKLLQSFFRTQSGEIAIDAGRSQIHRQLQRKRITDKEKKLAYALKAKLSTNSSEAELINRLEALEQTLLLNAGNLHPEIVAYTALDLKTTYLQLSDALINSAQMSPSRASLKFTLAQQYEKDGSQSKSRALYADVMLDSHEAMLGLAAKNLFANSFVLARQFALLSQLLGQSKVMGDFSGIEGRVSASILNYALEQGDANLISSIAPFLADAPENVDKHDWILQKARVDIFSGRFQPAKQKINNWLELSGALTGQQVDRVLQPVFDLQAVQQNELSLELFEQISEQTHSKRHKREILFWKAQSYDGLEQRITAAQYYLRSAMVEENGFDQWGQSARYHAAFTLMEAGSYFDARRLFEALLPVATDISQRATIKQSLQRLWLLENRLGG